MVCQARQKKSEYGSPSLVKGGAPTIFITNMIGIIPYFYSFISDNIISESIIIKKKNTYGDIIICEI